MRLRIAAMMTCGLVFGAALPALAQSPPGPPVLLLPGQDPPPVSNGWPDADSTGLYASNGSLRGQCASLCAAGVSSSGSFTSSSNGQTLQCKKINGSVTVKHRDITIRCVEISENDLTAVWIQSGADGTILEDAKVDMMGGSIGNEAIRLLNGPKNTTIARVEVTRAQDGIKIDSADTFTIKDSWIHNFQAPNSSSNHWDGLEMDGGAKNGTITGNNIDNQYSDTSAVMIDNWQGSNTNLTIDRNRLAGGGYTTYCDGNFNSNPLSGIAYTNNRIKKGIYGYKLYRGTCNPTFTGNVDDVTGKPIN